MWYTYSMSVTIGITELSRHARRYLDRVRAGETVVVTDHGEPVAELRPVPTPPQPSEGVLARLIAEGRARPATGTIEDFLAGYEPPSTEPGEPSSVDLVIQDRADERE